MPGPLGISREGAKSGSPRAWAVVRLSGSDELISEVGVGQLGARPETPDISSSTKPRVGKTEVRPDSTLAYRSSRGEGVSSRHSSRLCLAAFGGGRAGAARSTRTRTICGVDAPVGAVKTPRMTKGAPAESATLSTSDLAAPAA